MLNPYPSTATKGQLLDMVFEECGRAGYEFDRSPGEDASALRRIDGLMATWQAKGIALGYNFPAVFGEGSPADPLGIPDSAIDAVVPWAALRIAPGMGKTLSPETRKAMAEGYAFLKAETSTIPEMILPLTTARGIGHKPFSIWRPFETATWSDTLTLGDATVADSAATAANGYACAVEYTDGALLALHDSAGGKFTMINNILVGTGLSAGTYSPVLRQTYPGATNSPLDTTLTITVT